MSHHLDSPLARQDTRLDITDVYLFRGTTGTVFVMDVNSSIAGNRYPEAFHPEAMYEFKIDTDGDAVEDITYRVTFGHGESDGRLPFEVRRLDGPASRDRTADGVTVAEGRTEESISGNGGLRVWAGMAADPFYVEPTILGAVGKAVATGTRIDTGTWAPNEAVNLFAGTTVGAIVLEVPDGAFDTATIGFWGVTALATDAGGWRQINRAGMPMIQPIFHPDDTERSSTYNTTQPKDDLTTYGPEIALLATGLAAAAGTSADPQAHGRAIAELVFPDLLRYEIGTPATFGFATRNGRSFADNAPEIMFSIVLNAAIPTGLSAKNVAGTLRTQFPYVIPPVQTEATAVVAGKANAPV